MIKREEIIGDCRLILGDCREILPLLPKVDAVVTDPPYGIDAGNMTMGRGSRNDTGKNILKDWDVAPAKEYFDELMRVSKEQVIWGGNYFPLRPSRCFLIWDKLDYKSDFASAELAWTSFNKVVKTFQHARNNRTIRIHPTQKPTKLYQWILSNYAKPGDRILDTHLGSGSIAIACYDMGFDLTGYEIDKDYYDAAVNRLENHKKQLTLF